MHTATKHTRMEEDTVMASEDAPPQEKRQKKKQVTRKPLCTFVNYLKDTSAEDVHSNHSSRRNSPKTDGGEDDDDKMEEEENSFGGVSTEMKKLSLENNNCDCDSSTTSVETVNTSNKSVDAMVRDNRFNFDAATPAVDRWKDPPPSLPKHHHRRDLLLLDDEEALYITSRCESDTDSEEEMDKPKEIVIKKRSGHHHRSRRHRWQDRRTDVRALPIRGNITALPKITVRPYKV